MARLLLPALLAGAFLLPAYAQDGSVLGDWREPGGSVIRVATCGDAICARLVQLDPHAPGRVDAKNPDPSRRSQPLCNLQIGYGFHLADSAHAEDGNLYDPKSGKTYKGSMTVSGEQLLLRGYVGIKAFGRTERWTRVGGSTPTCE